MKWLTRRYALWLKRRKASKVAEELRTEYEPKMEKEKDPNERERLRYEWHFAEQEIFDPIECEESEELAARARMHGILVPPKSEQGNDWFRSPATGDWILSQSAFYSLAREVREEKRARSDEFRKWATLGFAILGFILGLVSLVRRTKPDSCPVNYYRTDSGACEFALKPNSGKAVPPKRQDSAEKGLLPH